MHLKAFLISLAVFGLCVDNVIAQSQSHETVEKGVIINGLKWATRNLDAHGKFVENPEDNGALFQWGRVGDGHEQPTSPRYPTDDASDENGVVSGTQNFDSNGQVVNTHAAYGKFIKQVDDPWPWRLPKDDCLWNSGSESTPVKTVNDPCPDGWRLPTQTEFATLGEGEWTSTPVAGCFIGNGDNLLFLPASGFRFCFNGSVNSVGYSGSYWSSTTEGDLAYYLHIVNGSEVIHPNFTNARSNGFSVRCVTALNTDATISNLTVSEGVLTPDFNADTLHYTVNVANEILSIFIEAIPNDPNATVNGDIGEKTLTVGNNPFTITVVAEDGETTLSYNVMVIRATVGIAESTATQINIYPNPTTWELKIESGELKVEKVEILDITGKTVLTSRETTINISQLSTGTYFMKLKTDKGELTKKVIKE